jgi:hypothetical protein
MFLRAGKRGLEVFIRMARNGKDGGEKDWGMG